MGEFAERPKQPDASHDTQPKQQERQPEPKLRPVGPIKFDRGKIDFAGVLHRATLGQEVRVHHDDWRDLVYEATIRGSNFSIDRPSSGVLPSEAKNEAPAPIAVRYRPETAGAHRAELAVVARPGYENGNADRRQPAEASQTVELDGFATNLGPGHDHATGDGPVPVMELADGGPAHDAGARHARTMAAIDAVSSLARTFDSVVPAGDAAVESFKDSIRAADADLNAHILNFVNDEGAHETARANSIENLGAIKGFLMTTGEITAEELTHAGAIPVALAALAVEWALEAKAAGDKHDEGRKRIAEYGEHMTGVMAHAGPALEASTNAMLKHYGGLVGGYAAARARLVTAATEGAKVRLVALQEAVGPAELEKQYQSSGETIRTFQRELEAWSHEVRRIAAASVQARSAAGLCFRRLLERYLAFKAAGGEHAEHPEKRQLLVIGHIDLGDPAMPRAMNIQLGGIQFGDYKDMSPTMRGFIEGQRLDELATWDVQIRLEGVQDDGSTAIVRVAGGRPLFAWNIGKVGYKASIMGVEMLWGLLTKGTLREHVIWVRS